MLHEANPGPDGFFKKHPLNSLTAARGLCAAALLATACNGAQAQGAAGAPTTAVQTIVITAQKREQPAQSVPVSVTALTGRDLEAAGIGSAALLDQVAAGVTVAASAPGYLTVTIRGISDLEGGLLGAPATGFYIDETPLSAFASQLPQVAYWDAERVEVLRGPQGTLFGEGSMGGSVRLITTKPDARALAARVQVSGVQVSGGGRGATARLMLNVPLQHEMLALRVTAGRQELPGWVDVPELKALDVNTGRADDARVALRWTPTARSTVDLSYAHQTLSSRDATATSPGRYKPSDVDLGAQAPAFLSARSSRYALANFTVQHDLGPAALVAALSRYERTSSVRTDLTPFVPLFFGVGGTAERVFAPLTVKAGTAELRLASVGESRLQWTAGLYAKEDARQQARTGLVISLPDLGLPRDETLYTTPARNRALAVFGDTEFRLPAGWAVQAGLRHYRARNQTQVRFDTTSAIFPGFTAGVVQDSGSSARADSPRLGLSWTPNPGLLVFAKLSTGFRDGDSNYRAPGYTEIPAAYGPEKLRAYELGLKAQPFSGVSLHASVYRNHWTDLQLPFVTSDGLFSYINNAARTESTGAEIELLVRPMAGLRLGLNLAGVDARIVDAGPAAGTSGVTQGKRIPFSPRWQATASATWEFALQRGLRTELSARYAYRGSTFSEPANDAALRNAAHETLYLRAGVRGPAWSAHLFGSNVGNGQPTQRKSAAPAGGIVDAQYVQPRTVGLEVGGSF
jgi:iron complex outermembrane recepter protein